MITEKVFYRQIHFFDMDGVLTPPKKKITKKSVQRLKDILANANNRIYILSGSTYDMVREQLNPSVLRMISGIFCCSGNEYWMRVSVEGKYSRIYSQGFDFPKRREFFTLLNELSAKGKFERQFDNTVEERPGMVNFSLLGRSAPYPIRRQYNEWDKEVGEREEVAQIIRERFGKWLDVVIGGEISMDIYVRGNNKFQAVKYLDGYYKDLDSQLNPERRIINHYYYHADRLEEGGNDKCVLDGFRNSKTIKKWTVIGYETETQEWKWGQIYGSQPNTINGNRRFRGSSRKKFFRWIDDSSGRQKYGTYKKKNGKPGRPPGYRPKKNDDSE